MKKKVFSPLIQLLLSEIEDQLEPLLEGKDSFSLTKTQVRQDVIISLKDMVKQEPDTLINVLADLVTNDVFEAVADSFLADGIEYQKTENEYLVAPVINEIEDGMFSLPVQDKVLKALPGTLEQIVEDSGVCEATCVRVLANSALKGSVNVTVEDGDDDYELKHYSKAV